MKIRLDRRKCDSWIGACEACFSEHYLGREVLPNYCLVDIEEDGQPDRTFVILDKDGGEKVLVVDEENWAEIQDSWFLYCQKLAAVGLSAN